MINFRKYNNVTSITMHPNQRMSNTIMYYGFADRHNLRTITLSDEVVNINYGFNNCSNLVHAVCGNNITSMYHSYENCTNLKTAVCGPNVTSFAYTYNNCTNLESAVCGPNVTYMYYTYSGCKKLTEPVCGPNVTDMSYAFEYCSNLTHAVCGPNVQTMYVTYRGCTNITVPVFGPNVTNVEYTYQNSGIINPICPDTVTLMKSTYTGCNNIKTAVCADHIKYLTWTYSSCNNLTTAACGPNVLSLGGAYSYCSNLTTPVCGDKVTNLSNCYYNCFNLTSAVCGPNVADLSNTYKACYNLTTPVCGDKVVTMEYAYYNCVNLTTAACGPNVTNLAYAYYGCDKITEPVVGPNVKDMSYAYFKCTKLAYGYLPAKLSYSNYAYSYCSNLKYTVIDNGLSYIDTGTFLGCVNLTTASIPPSVRMIGNNAFSDCSSLQECNFSQHITLPKLDNSFRNLPSSCKVTIKENLIQEAFTRNDWTPLVNNIASLEATEVKVFDRFLKDTNYCKITNTFQEVIHIFNANLNNTTFTVTSNNSDVIVENVSVHQVVGNHYVASFDARSVNGTECSASLSINLSCANKTIARTITLQFVPYAIPTYEIDTLGEPVDDTFTLNENGFYESGNYNDGFSLAVCKININNPDGLNVYLDCIHDGVGTTNFAYTSNVNATLNSYSYSPSNDSGKIKYNLQGQNSKEIQSLDYGTITSGYIYVKYVSTGYYTKPDDCRNSLQFKVRFEYIAPAETE